MVPQNTHQSRGLTRSPLNQITKTKKKLREKYFISREQYMKMEPPTTSQEPTHSNLLGKVTGKNLEAQDIEGGHQGEEQHGGAGILPFDMLQTISQLDLTVSEARLTMVKKMLTNRMKDHLKDNTRTMETPRVGVAAPNVAATTTRSPGKGSDLTAPAGTIGRWETKTEEP